MTTRTTTWAPRARRALTSTGNLLAGAGAVALAALTWNPLPLILFGLGQPVWLYRAVGSRRVAAAVRADATAARLARRQRARARLELDLDRLVAQSPCGGWLRRGLLPDYPRSYRRLTALRDQARGLVDARRDAATALEQDVIGGLDEMLIAYLTMARARLVFHAGLAGFHVPIGALAGGDAAPPPGAPGRPVEAGRPADVDLVTVADAIAAVRTRAAALVAAIDRAPEQDEVYRPLITTLAQRQVELAERGRRDQLMAAQLDVVPDQVALVLARLADARADAGELVTGMQLLLEQVDDTVRFAADVRRPELDGEDDADQAA